MLHHSNLDNDITARHAEDKFKITDKASLHPLLLQHGQ